LLENDTSVLLCPSPSVLEELLASKVRLVDALLLEAFDHLGFGSDRCVVGTRHPASVLALKASTTNQDILDSIVEHVTHV